MALQFCGPTTCTASARPRCCRRHDSKQHRGTFRIPWGHHVSAGDQELGFLHVDMESFTFHASLPCLELGDTLLLGVHDEHQVISLERLRWHTCAMLTRKRFQYQGKDQCARDRTPMHTNSHAKFLTVLSIDPHTTPGIGVHALDDTQSHSVTLRLLKTHFRTFLGT